jgi:flagellar motor switch protein FliG
MAKRIETISGLRKAAILMVSLDTETAAKIMGQLDREELERVTVEIARLGDVPDEMRQEVIEEYYTTSMASAYLEEGGLDYARRLLERSLKPEEAAQILEVVEQSIQMAPFHFLQKADPANLLAFIQDEHPQTITLILSHLKPAIGAEVLAGLPPQKQLDVARRLAKMEQTTPDAIERVESGLQRRLFNMMSQDLRKTGGVETIAEILNLADRSTEKTILESMEEEDPELVEQIRRLMFVFEDILLVNDKGIQSVLREVDTQELALALRNASEDLKNKIFTNMSERAAELVREEMEYMGPVRLSDIEAAQQRIVDIVRKLEEQGDVIIQGRGGEEEIVV